MSLDLKHFAGVFLAFFAIMNPLVNAPIFLGLTSNLSTRQRRQVAVQSTLAAFLIVAVFVFLGKTVFEAFDITLPAFRIAGGLLIFWVGTHLLQGEPSKVHRPTSAQLNPGSEAVDDVALSPLAIPILAGPGTIAVAMGYAGSGSLSTMLETIAALALVTAMVTASFLMAERVFRLVGPRWLVVVSRLMGMILTFIGVQMVIEGVTQAVELAKSS